MKFNIYRTLKSFRELSSVYAFDSGLVLLIFMSLGLYSTLASAQLKCSDLIGDTPAFYAYKELRNRFNASLMPNIENYRSIPRAKLAELKPGEDLTVLEAQGEKNSVFYSETIADLERKSLVKPVINADIFKGNELLRVIDDSSMDLFKRTGLLHDNFDADVNRWDRNSNLALTIGQQSKSIVRRDLGLDVVRSYSWLKSANGDVNLERVHIARNYRKDGTPFSLEMLINNGTEWKAFYFEIEGNYWRLQEKIHEKDVEQVCMRCHVAMGLSGKIAKGKMSPRPFFMKDEAAWYRGGFKDKNLVKRLLGF